MENVMDLIDQKMGNDPLRAPANLDIPAKSTDSNQCLCAPNLHTGPANPCIYVSTKELYWNEADLSLNHSWLH